MTISLKSEIFQETSSLTGVIDASQLWAGRRDPELVLEALSIHLELVLGFVIHSVFCVAETSLHPGPIWTHQWLKKS